MKKIRSIIRYIQKYGAPHEETVIIPSIITVILMHQSDIGKINQRYLAPMLECVFILSGIWLGIGWSNDNAIKVAFRSIYSEIIISLLYAVSTENHYSLKEYVNLSILVISTLGLIFYLGWFISSVIRQLLFLTDEERKLGVQRRRWMSYMSKAVAFRAKPLSTVDGYIVLSLRSILGGIIFKAFYILAYYFLSDYIGKLPPNLRGFL